MSAICLFMVSSPFAFRPALANISSRRPRLKRLDVNAKLQKKNLKAEQMHYCNVVSFWPFVHPVSEYANSSQKPERVHFPSLK